MQTLLQNYSEIAPKLGLEIAPKCVPKGSKMAPWRPPGGLGGPWGTPGGPRQIFQRFGGSFWVRFDDPKSLQNASKLKLNPGSLLMLQFVIPEASWIAFWVHFRVIWGCFLDAPGGKQEFVKNSTALKRELDF